MSAVRDPDPLLPTLRAHLSVVERLVEGARSTQPTLTPAGRLILRQMEQEMAEETPLHTLLWDVLLRQLQREHEDEAGPDDAA
jgi:hypothetical protein